ncbi:guanosine-3',5'-bis(diphosphate) 3'-pyrophosphohydrolase MESH1-like [Ctenocephalides felis]|uniref:guanosine-3',5'-bis(diphosphate) 3'-pyrophosphohydrolase MESH1-like n=1 Tax=Ctenocephalides felis TaxID=7515 RepID=UPI000E6E29D4|nr:guanosine-3',5'-bis(diphosphate) 3'-pyrophosphohydrolase MESH1-like [Ctenocephalides felis]
MSKFDIHLYTKCVNFAALKHKDQRRKDAEKTPYINHPIGVASILTNEAFIEDQNVLMAALLHDTVEDTNTTFEEIEKEFGTVVRAIVEEVTDDKNLPKLERKRLQIVHAPTSSHSAKLVKLADKLYNLRDLERAIPVGWSKSYYDEYYRWAFLVIDGLRGTNAVLERELDDIFKRRGLLSESGDQEC